MPSYRRFLSRRRLLAFLGAAALLFGLAMLHPYPRQSLFGPKINGIPWCVWESQIRRAAVPSGSRSWLLTTLEALGLLKPPHIMDSPELLPVYLHLANDNDWRVRRICLWSLERRVLIDELWRWSEEDEAKIFPVVRQHLQDDDPMCRLICAEYLWRATKDRELIKVPLAYLDHPDPFIHQGACIALCYLAEADLDKSFDPVVKLAWDPKMKMDVRTTAVQSLRHFGKRGFPFIRKALNDPVSDIRSAAMWAVREMGRDARELVPTLLAMQNDADPNIRRWAGLTLNKISPDQFAAPARPQE